MLSQRQLQAIAEIVQQKSPFRVSRVYDIRAWHFRASRRWGATMSIDSEGPHASPILLVVDDEVLVRMLACDILTDGGFHCLEAVNAQEALALIDARPDIGLMFTDVDMPGEVNGAGLAHLVAMRAPAVKILVTSGAAALQPNDLPAGARFIQKPYTPSELLDLIGEMLAAGA